MSSDRLFLEQQIRQMDGMMRMLVDMRSVLVRRQRGNCRSVSAIPRRVPVRRVNELVLNLSPLFEREVDVEMVEVAPVPRRQRVPVPKKVTKVLKKADLSQTMPDVCSICQEMYEKKDSVTTNCNNHFCVSCFTQWMTTKQTSCELVSCPLCRAQVTQVVMYRARAPRKPKNEELVQEIENDVVMRGTEGFQV